MSSSHTTSHSFTKTNAKKLGAKVASDMYQCLQLYGMPDEEFIVRYQEELVVLLTGKFLEEYEYGFRTGDGERVLSWLYQVAESGDMEGGRSGGLYTAADVSSARWFNFLTPSKAWWRLTADEKQKFIAQHTISREPGNAPVDGKGTWVADHQYASGGMTIVRKEFRPL